MACYHVEFVLPDSGVYMWPATTAYRAGNQAADRTNCSDAGIIDYRANYWQTENP